MLHRESPIMDPTSWTHRPPSPPTNPSTTPPSHPSLPTFPSSRPGPSRRASHNPSLAETTLSLSALSLPLGAPLSRPASHPAPLHTPTSSTPDPPTHPGAVTIPPGAGGVLSPPTPAPSPTPRETWPYGGYPKEESDDEADEDVEMGFSEGRWKGKDRDNGEFWVTPNASKPQSGLEGDWGDQII